MIIRFAQLTYILCSEKGETKTPKDAPKKELSKTHTKEKKTIIAIPKKGPFKKLQGNYIYNRYYDAISTCTICHNHPIIWTSKITPIFYLTRIPAF